MQFAGNWKENRSIYIAVSMSNTLLWLFNLSRYCILVKNVDPGRWGEVSCLRDKRKYLLSMKHFGTRQPLWAGYPEGSCIWVCQKLLSAYHEASLTTQSAVGSGSWSSLVLNSLYRQGRPWTCCPLTSPPKCWEDKCYPLCPFQDSQAM